MCIFRFSPLTRDCVYECRPSQRPCRTRTSGSDGVRITYVHGRLGRAWLVGPVANVSEQQRPGNSKSKNVRRAKQIERSGKPLLSDETLLRRRCGDGHKLWEFRTLPVTTHIRYRDRSDLTRDVFVRVDTAESQLFRNRYDTTRHRDVYENVIP